MSTFFKAARPYTRPAAPPIIYPPSETVPDDCYTIQELFQRYVSGQDLGNIRRPSFYDDNSNLDSPDMEKVRDMDFVERDEIVSDIAKRGKESKERLDALQKEKEAKLRSDELEMSEIKETHRKSKRGQVKEVKDEKAGKVKDERSEE